MRLCPNAYAGATGTAKKVIRMPPYEQCEKFYRKHLDKVRRGVIVVIEQTDNKEEYCAAGVSGGCS